MPPTLLCVHPHPDDESIACGGVLARAADEGARTVVVTCTGGEQGENLAGIDLGGDDIAVHRARELEAALDVLGVAGRYRLGYRDSGMAGEPSNEHPDCLHVADLDEAAGRLAGILRRERPDIVVSDGPDGSYGHPDHVRACQLTTRAVELAADPHGGPAGEAWQVPRRYWHVISRSRVRAIDTALRAAGLTSPFSGTADEFGAPDAEVTHRVDVTDVLDRKRAAMAAHASQIGPDSFFLNTPRELAGSAFGVEEFVLAGGAVPGGDVAAVAGL